MMEKNQHIENGKPVSKMLPHVRFHTNVTMDMSFLSLCLITLTGLGINGPRLVPNLLMH